MPFDDVRKLIKRDQVTRGMERMQPPMRELATRLMERFLERRDEPLPITDEGAALALWGSDKPEAFLVWHRDQGGLARVLDVLLAAITYEKVAYEWDSSVWALRRARPANGLSNLGASPWLWLRAELAKAKPAERGAAREVASRASRAWLVRAALAFVFPDDAALWTAADETELRQVDVDEHANVLFGVLAAMRQAKLDHDKIEREWQIADAIEPDAIVAHLGDRAVAPLRLLRAYADLAARDAPDALRALAEFSDTAWDALAEIEPTEDAIAALAPMFTRQRPRRVLGLGLAHAMFREFVVAAPAEAEQLVAAKSADADFIAHTLAETGVRLPADAGWTSPWAAKPKQAKPKPAAKPPAKQPLAIKFTDKLHWTKAERATALGDDDERDLDRAKEKEKEKEILKEAKTGQVLMFELTWLTDEPALRIWKAIPPKRWYGQIDDVQHVLARFGLAELDSVLAFVQSKPETLAALAPVESPRVAPLMARGYALIKKQQEVGRAWLDRFPEAAAIGLLLETGADRKQRDANDKAFAYLAKQHAKIVDDVIARTGVSIDTAQLASADAPTLPAKPPKLPLFVDVAVLPRPIRTDGAAALAGDALVELVQALKVTLPGGHAVLDAIAARYTPDSLARCAWSLFRQWLFANAPPKDKWAMYAVGKFPDDDNARSLGRLARVWAPQGNSARAQEAVETLALMRTQGGLLEIHDIARKVQSKALKARAEKVFETVATGLGLAPEELADRLVPELSEQDLTFGNLRVELDAHLAPHLVAPDGSITTALPGKPEPDDAARWKELKRLCGTVARGQLARLEQWMAEGHRMPFAHFAEVYLMHSLIRHVSSALVWGAYRGGKRVLAFGVEGDGAIDAAGKPIELLQDATYGVIHPAELADKERTAWTARLPNQPFEQLARQVFAAVDARDVQQKLAKLTGRVVQTTGLLALQSLGWKRGESPGGGQYYSMQREGEGWFAELVFDPGIYLGRPAEQATQSLEAIVFRAIAPPPPAILSDIQRDLARLAR